MDDQDFSDIMAADDRRREASVAGDIAALTEILAPDFTYIHNTGFRDDRTSYLATLSDGTVRITALDRLSAVPRRVGDIVLIDGEARMHYRMPPTAPEASFVSLYLAVWVREGERWRLSAYASTLKQPA